MGPTWSSTVDGHAGEAGSQMQAMGSDSMIGEGRGETGWHVAVKTFL